MRWAGVIEQLKLDGSIDLPFDDDKKEFTITNLVPDSEYYIMVSGDDLNLCV